MLQCVYSKAYLGAANVKGATFIVLLCMVFYYLLAAFKMEPGQHPCKATWETTHKICTLRLPRHRVNKRRKNIYVDIELTERFTIFLFGNKTSNKLRMVGKEPLCLCLCTKTPSRQIRIDKHLRSRKKTQQSQRLSGCKLQSGCFFHPTVYRRGYSLLFPLQITACLADLNIAIKPFPSFCVSLHCAAEASGPIAQGGRCCLIHLPLPLHCSGRNRGLVWRVCVTTAHGKHTALAFNPRYTTHTAAQL